MACDVIKRNQKKVDEMLKSKYMAYGEMTKVIKAKIPVLQTEEEKFVKMKKGISMSDLRTIVYRQCFSY
jgi:hypothetical protein